MSGTARWSSLRLVAGFQERRSISSGRGCGRSAATTHKLARLVYRMWKYGMEYVSEGLARYEAKVKVQTERRLRKKASAMGYELVAKPGAATARRRRRSGGWPRVYGRPSQRP